MAETKGIGRLMVYLASKHGLRAMNFGKCT